MYLRDRCDKDGKCYPAIGTIAKELKLLLSTVKRAIADLEKSGYLRSEQRWRENGGTSSNMFYLTKVDCLYVEFQDKRSYLPGHQKP